MQTHLHAALRFRTRRPKLEQQRALWGNRLDAAGLLGGCAAAAARVASAPTYSPLDEGSCVAWIDVKDPAAFAQSGGTMVSLVNKATASTWSTFFSAAPTYDANGLSAGQPSMVFDSLLSQGIGSSEAAVIAAFNGADLPYTLFQVFKPALADTTGTLFNVANGTTSSHYMTWEQNNGGFGTYRCNKVAGTNSIITTTASPLVAPQVTAWWQTGIAISHSINNAAAQPAGAAQDTLALTGLTRFAIGARVRPTLTDWWSGNHSSLIVYSTQLSTAAIGRVFTYLGSRFAITIS